jgi:adenylate cyclase
LSSRALSRPYAAQSLWVKRFRTQTIPSSRPADCSPHRDEPGRHHCRGGEIFGGGVNIASRIEALAEPGTIYISAAVYDRIVGKIDFDFIDLGPQNLKNISKPIRVYRMDADVAMRWAVAASAGTGSPAGARFDDRRAIAVLPFANFGGEADQEYFADGITEDIISMLAGWRAFPVIARNSTFNYKGTTVDVRKVGEELGVRYVLEGSVANPVIGCG